MNEYEYEYEYQIITVKLQKAVNTSYKYFWNVVELQENMESFVRKLLPQVVTVLVHCF